MSFFHCGTRTFKKEGYLSASAYTGLVSGMPGWQVWRLEELFTGFIQAFHSHHLATRSLYKSNLSRQLGAETCFEGRLFSFSLGERVMRDVT
jgi:hypothetical protein